MILGEILASSFERAGYYTLVYPEYPSRIRGGDNNIQIVVAETPHIAPREKVDFLFTMDADLENVHQNEVNPGGVFFEALKDVNMRMRSEVERIVGENWQVKNSAVAGIIWRNCQLSPSILLGEIKSKLVGKNLELNLKVAKEGYKFELGKDFFRSNAPEAKFLVPRETRFLL